MLKRAKNHHDFDVIVHDSHCSIMASSSVSRSNHHQTHFCAIVYHISNLAPTYIDVLFHFMPLTRVYPPCIHLLPLSNFQDEEECGCSYRSEGLAYTKLISPSVASVGHARR